MDPAAVFTSHSTNSGSAADRMTPSCSIAVTVMPSDRNAAESPSDARGSSTCARGGEAAAGGFAGWRVGAGGRGARGVEPVLGPRLLECLRVAQEERFPFLVKERVRLLLQRHACAGAALWLRGAAAAGARRGGAGGARTLNHVAGAEPLVALGAGGQVSELYLDDAPGSALPVAVLEASHLRGWWAGLVDRLCPRMPALLR